MATVSVTVVPRAAFVPATGLCASTVPAGCVVVAVSERCTTRLRCWRVCWA